MYVHIKEISGRLYLGYWWFLPFNVSPWRSDVNCLPGFTFSGLTCHDHDGDWEGVTVELSLHRKPLLGQIPVLQREARGSAVRLPRQADPLEVGQRHVGGGPGTATPPIRSSTPRPGATPPIPPAAGTGNATRRCGVPISARVASTASVRGDTTTPRSAARCRPR